MTLAKRRVLCAETHTDICELIEMLLAAQGHEVLTARSLHECLELARRERFDLYMLDDEYMDGSGIELCRGLRALTPETPILFFSALALPRDRERALEAGALAYLTKPDDIFEIVETVNSILLTGHAKRSLNERQRP